MIDTVVFDMDGVLSRPMRQHRLELLGRWSGRTTGEIDEAIFRSSFESDAEQGRWGADEYLREFGVRLGYGLNLDEWITARQAAMQPDHEVLAIAEAIATTHRIAMFTNNPLLLARCFDRVFPEAASLFGDRAVFSAQLGSAKPRPAAFLALAQRLGAAPGSILFFDDEPGYVEGARRAGLSAEVFVDAEQLRSDLRAHGVPTPG